MQKVIINAALGGDLSGMISDNIIEKDYNLEISRLIYDKLKSMGVNAYLVRNADIDLSEEERLEIIDAFLSKDDFEVILLTNKLGNNEEAGAEIIYSLRNSNELALMLAQSIENTGQDVLKYYQLRDPNNTALDYYDIIKNTDPNVESIIVSYGSPMITKDNDFLISNMEILANGIADSIYSYLTKANVYFVKPGDTLYSIAKKFNVSVEDLKNANGLSSNNLDIGMELIIPKKEIEKPSPEEPDTPLVPDDYILHAIVKGDTLYSIAKKYNTTVEKIKEFNNLESNNLQIGEVLKIPTIINLNNYIIYKVKKGDTLYSIARTYNTTVLEIKNLNNLTSDNLSIDMNLKIPNPSDNTRPNYTNYVVKKGDTLYSIARTYNTTVLDIMALNNLNSSSLQIGEVLKIPLK